MKKFNKDEYYNELVPMTILDDGESSDIVVTLNGYNYVIKKGQTVLIPRKVCMVIEDSMTQKNEAKNYIQSLLQR